MDLFVMGISMSMQSLWLYEEEIIIINITIQEDHPIINKLKAIIAIISSSLVKENREDQHIDKCINRA